METTTNSESGESRRQGRQAGPARGNTNKQATARKGTRRNGRADARPDGGYGQAAMIGAAAAGLLAGLAMTVGRRAAMQAMSAMAGDWLDTIKAEHRAALRIFDKIEATSDNQTAKRTLLLMQLKHALAKHAFEEENVIYPAMRDNEEREEADHLTHDHGYVKQFLFELEHSPRGAPAWLAMVRDFRRTLEKHIDEEEQTLFPRLREGLTREENNALTTALHKEGFKLA